MAAAISAALDTRCVAAAAGVEAARAAAAMSASRMPLAPQDVPGLCGIIGDHLQHGVDRVELLLGPEEGDQLGLDGLAVDVFVEVEDPDFEAWLDLAGGGIGAYVGDTGKLAPILQRRSGGVDAQLGDHVFTQRHVGGGDAELATQLLALLDHAFDGERPAEQARGKFWIAVLQRGADAAGGDLLAGGVADLL